MDLSAIRASARSKADEQSTGFITDTELDRFINQGLRYVHGNIIQEHQDYFIVKGTVGNGGLITVSANDNDYSLPSTMLKLLRVERRDSNDTNENNWRKLQRLNIGNDQMNDYFPVREGYDNGYGYFLAGDLIILRPCPTSGFDLRLWFIARVTDLSASTDTPGVPSEYHELIAEYAAIQCLRKSGNDQWKESLDLFKLELQSMIDTLQHRVHEPEQMIITDDFEYDRWSS